jgi:class 3 adenylate cyclase
LTNNDTSNLRDELEQALKFQKATAHVLTLIRRHPQDLAAIFQSIVSTASRLCDAEHAVFFTRQDRSYFAEVVESVDPEWLQYLRDHPTPATRQSFAGRTGIEQRTVHVKDVLQDKEYTRFHVQRVGGFRTLLGVPILIDNHTIAVICLLRAVVKPFTTDQIHLVETFADQASIAIGNARNLEGLASKTSDLAELNDELEARVAEQLAALKRHAVLRNFLPPKVADMVLSNPNSELLESHRRNVVAIFCDLRRFTSFSESAEPEEVMLVLQQFHTITSELAARHDGTIVSRVGDGVLIVVNDPVPIDSPVKKALALISEMRTALAVLAQAWNECEYDLGFGIGASYGYATLGMVGSSDYQNYTAIGTVVNVASRLSDIAKDGEALVTQRVRTEAADAFEFEEMGQLELKGLKRSIHVLKLV